MHRPFAVALTGLAVLHHLLMFIVFRKIYRTSVPGSRYAPLYPLGNVIIDVILLWAIRMCLTGRVRWRGKAFAPTAGRATAVGSRGG